MREGGRGVEKVDGIVYRGMNGWGRSFSRARGTPLPINELHASCINQYALCTTIVVDVSCMYYVHCTTPLINVPRRLISMYCITQVVDVPRILIR